MRKEHDLLTAIDNGEQTIISQSASPQVVYLDFDGASTSYYNRDLDIAIDNVTVTDSGFDSATISVIVDALNGLFDDVSFTADIPSEGDFSTIYIGVTSAFDEYGTFLGLAETIDSGNQIHDDNAFVLLDSSATAQMVVSVIAHETEHIVRGMEHGGEGLARFASTIVLESGQYSSGPEIYDGNILIVRSGGTVGAAYVYNDGKLYVSDVGIANRTRVLYEGVVHVYSGGTANSSYLNEGSMCISNGGTGYFTTVDSYGHLRVYNGGLATSTNVTFCGELTVSNGGMATRTDVTSYGNLNVSNGGIANDTALNLGGAINISNGGTASNTTLNNNGSMVVSNGGTANITTVDNNGSMAVSEGGKATSTTVNNGGSMAIANGGMANSTTVNAYGLLYVSEGGTATNIVENGGDVEVVDGATVSFMPHVIQGLALEQTTATIHSGTTANEMSVTNGVINVFSGGSAKKTTVNNDAIINIASGCADETNVNGNGAMYIFGGTANRTNLDNGGGMGIYSGGTATSTTVNTNASMYVFENGSAVSTTISHGWLKVHDGGSANYTTVDMGGSLNVLDGGKATNIIENGGYVEFADDTTVNFMQHVIQGLTLENTTATIHPATTVSETTLGVGCSMYLLGGKAISVTMDSGAIMHVSSGGTATRTAVNSNGLMHVSSGGTATSVTVNSFGVMRVSSGAQATSATVDTNGNMYIMSGAQATSTTVNLGGWLMVYDSGIVNETTVAGIMRVEWGGMATRTTVDSDGTVSVFSGATATSTTVNSGGKMWVISGGTALDVVNSGGRVGGYVLGGDTAVLSGRHQDDTVFYISGGTANNIIGGLFLSNGGIAYNTTVDSGSDLRVMSGCTAAYTTVGNGGSAYVGNGGTMHLSTTVNSGGSLFVDSGGAAFGLVNSGGYVGGVVVGGDTQTFVAGKNQDGTVFFISNGVASNVSGWLNVSGGVANRTTVDGFIMQVDGTVNDTTVNSGGTMQLLGGVANYTTLNGSGTLMDVIGASANFTTMNSGASIWLEGGTANRTTMNGGSFSLLSYGVANSTIVNGGYLKLSKGVTANDTIVNSGGSMEVFSSFVNNITVNGGSVGIGYDGMIRGNISIASGAILLVNSYAKMDFTVAEQDDPAKPLIDHFDYISAAGDATYTLTVAAEQASGVYVLAGDANNFRSKSVMVKTVVGDEIGSLSVGGSIKDASRMYSLVMDSDNTLSLKVIKYHTVTNFSAEGDGCFAEAAAEGEAILFANAGEYSYTDGLAATKAIEVIGDGADMTTLEGGNFYMNGNEATFSNLTLDGMVFGGTASSYSEIGDVALSFSNVNFAEGKRVYGGTDVAESIVATVGDITLAIDGGNGAAARVFGAGRVADSAFLKVGDINLTVSCAEDGSFLNIFAGADVVAGFSGGVTCDDVSTVIDGGIFTYAGNGSQLRGGESSQKNSTLTVNGGTFNHYVYAGAFSMGGEATVVGDTTLAINGGTFNSHVFGGCGADNSADGEKTSIDGNAAVIVNTSNNTVSFSGNVYAGSMGSGYIDGVTSMTFTGLGSNLTFASGSYVTGNSQMFRRTDQYVSGEQTLAFDGFSGDFGANVNNGFTRLSLKGSNVKFTGEENVTLSRISTWEIEVGSAEAELDLTLSKGKNSFKGDSLTLTLADSATPDSSGWDVIAGTEATLSGWDKFATVTLCGEAATYDKAIGEWGSVSYRLFMEDDTLKLATIA